MVKFESQELWKSALPVDAVFVFNNHLSSKCAPQMMEWNKDNIHIYVIRIYKYIHIYVLYLNIFTAV